MHKFHKYKDISIGMYLNKELRHQRKIEYLLVSEVRERDLGNSIHQARASECRYFSKFLKMFHFLWNQNWAEQTKFKKFNKSSFKDAFKVRFGFQEYDSWI